MITVKPIWKMVQKRFWIFTVSMCCGFPALLLSAIIFSQRSDIQNNPPYLLVLFAFIAAAAGSLFSYLLFISSRITFDGKKLCYRRNFCVVRFSIEEIFFIEYRAQYKLLLINRHAFICNFFDAGDMTQLQEAVARYINQCERR